MASAYKWMQFDHSDGIASVTLDRPPLNILSTEMMGEMLDAFDRIPPSDTRLLLLRAKGKAFSAGVEVGEHLGPALRPMIENFHGLFRRLIAFDFPLVAVVEGPCLGGGCELASIFDFVIATDDAKFGQPEIQLGVFPPVAALLLPDRIGDVATRDLVLTGRIVSPAEAWDLGLIWKVVSTEDLEEDLEALLRSLLSSSPTALRMAKRALSGRRRREFLEGLDEIETFFLEELMPTADAEEGLRAFLEKRKPVWRTS
jgi:cyclohexa-1,5-dienecarbonyl-CoA hydratase